MSFDDAEWSKMGAPATQGEGWGLFCGDAVELLQRLPTASVDLSFAAPPYFLSNGATTCRGGKRVAGGVGGWDASRGVAADHAFHVRWLAEVQRVLRPTGTLWVSGTHHAIFSIGYALQELGFHLLNTITWTKPNAPPLLSCRQFAFSTELLIWASPSRQRPLAHRFDYRAMKDSNGGHQMRDMWRFDELPTASSPHLVWAVPVPGRSERTEGRHPAQKPLGVLRRVMTASAVAGGLVLDPFAGSGTTGIAALEAGCRFVGLEREPEYVALATRRLKRRAASGASPSGQLGFFDGPPGVGAASRGGASLGATNESAEGAGLGRLGREGGGA